MSIVWDAVDWGHLCVCKISMECIFSCFCLSQVNDYFRWEEIQELFHIPQACTNAAQALKQIYIRFVQIQPGLHLGLKKKWLIGISSLGYTILFHSYCCYWPFHKSKQSCCYHEGVSFWFYIHMYDHVYMRSMPTRMINRLKCLLVRFFFFSRTPLHFKFDMNMCSFIEIFCLYTLHIWWKLTFGLKIYFQRCP